MFLPLRWSLIMLRPISQTLVSSTTNSNIMPKSGQTGKRPDYRSVESSKETKNVDHEAQSMNGGGGSMSHNEKRGAGIGSMSLGLRNQRVQNDEMYLVDDIDTKLL
jgi:hypothetical protein